ncbi:unnamed protein product [Sphagnum troendelagicum]|uniref:PGG domain-containing protein n=1 Tax=Sphagnum troendelagicum TaxID=128251 RepID=A0ABP0UH26_9BRYO
MKSSQNVGGKVKDKAGRTGTNDRVGGNGTNDRVGYNVLSGGGRKGAKDGGRGEKVEDGVGEDEKKLPEIIHNALPAIYPGRTALHMAAANGNVKIVREICGKDVDLNKKTFFDWDPQRKNDSKVLDVDAKSKSGLTAFHIAVKEAVKAKKRTDQTDQTERDDFKTMIVGFIRFMNKHSPEAINKSDKTKSTPLHTCVVEKDYELVELLLEDGDKIDPELLDAKGRTALEIAVHQGDYRMVQKIQRYLERAGLFGDHQAYADSANAILVGAALLATVTFTAWVQIPTNDSTLFWVFISFSFYFAIATFIAAAGAAIPSRGSTLGLVRRAVLASAICLEISLGCAVAAFATAGFLILPPGKPHRKVIATTAIGGFVCFFFLLTFLRKITRALDPIFLWLDYKIQSLIKERVWKPVTKGVTSRPEQMKCVEGLKKWYEENVTDPDRKPSSQGSTDDDSTTSFPYVRSTDDDSTTSFPHGRSTDDKSTTSSAHDRSTASSHNKKSEGSSSVGRGSGGTGSNSSVEHGSERIIKLKLVSLVNNLCCDQLV